MNGGLVPEMAQTWVNRHLKFTHGYGLVMSPVNTKDQEGLPNLYVKNIPPESNVGLKITQPGIYFGEEPDNYIIVKGLAPEFDYASGNDNVFSFYSGSGGVPVSGFWRRLVFSLYYRDINLLVTGNIVPGIRIMLQRNINVRINAIAPFLNQDRDPYMIVYNGAPYLIVDSYTVSDHYPYSQKNGDQNQINYIRNSAKAVINAYTRDSEFHGPDPDRPLIRTM